MKVLVVDDHAVVRQGIGQLMARIPDTVVFEAADIAQATLMWEAHVPDVVVIDINLEGSNGLELVRRLGRAGAGARIVVFTMHADPAYATRALSAGALGFVSKTAPPEELIAAVRHAVQGNRYVDMTLAEQVAQQFGVLEDPMKRLSQREREILWLLGEGKSMSDMAVELGVAYKTIANTALRLKDKVGAHSSADLVRIAIEHRRSKP